jgi:hypothetical protein
MLCCFGNKTSALVKPDKIVFSLYLKVRTDPTPASAFCSKADAALFARLSSSRGALGPLGAFAGGVLPTTILNCCVGALLPMLSTSSVLPLRATCKEA